jgi:hydroxyacyl-ACP dehydratase HTD2-like protein with hotdog domain
MVTEPAVFWEDLRVGAEIPPIRKRISEVMIFQFSAANWISHRIHYDKDNAVEEGFRDVAANGPLQAHALIQAVTDWAGGDPGVFRKLSYRNRRPAYPGDILTARGVVTRLYAEGGDRYAECDLWTENQDGEKTTVGTATLRLPTRGAIPAG